MRHERHSHRTLRFKSHTYLEISRVLRVVNNSIILLVK
jgi:hypothetical protein